MEKIRAICVSSFNPLNAYKHFITDILEAVAKSPFCLSWERESPLAEARGLFGSHSTLVSAKQFLKRWQLCVLLYRICPSEQTWHFHGMFREAENTYSRRKSRFRLSSSKTTSATCFGSKYGGFTLKSTFCSIFSVTLLGYSCTKAESTYWRWVYPLNIP